MQTMPSNKKFQNLIESLESEYFFYSHDLDGKYVYISPSIEKVLGYSVQEAFKGIVQYKTDSELNTQTLETLRKSAKGEKQNTFELELYTKDHKKKIIQITESPVFGKTGEIESIDGIAHDVTEKKLASLVIREQNKKLTKQKESLQLALKNLRDTQSQLIHSEKMGALGHLTAGIAHEINTPLGAVQASVSNIQQSFNSFVNDFSNVLGSSENDDLWLWSNFIALIKVEKSNLTSKEKRILKKDISCKLQEAGIENIHFWSDQILYLRMESSLDELVPLVKMKNASRIIRLVRDCFSVKKNADNIQLAVDKASKVVFALKKFTHKDQNDELEEANILDSIETVLTLLYNQIKQGIDVVRDFDSIPAIMCYPDELIQVWSNLISNAIQAMEHSGTLTIRVTDLQSSIEVQIQDTGTGIPEEIREKIFEPFFTTKKAGEGTGLGLDLVKKIIDKHNASLNLESTVGVGTTFKITLPKTVEK